MLLNLIYELISRVHPDFFFKYRRGIENKSNIYLLIYLFKYNKLFKWDIMVRHAIISYKISCKTDEKAGNLYKI